MHGYSVYKREEGNNIISKNIPRVSSRKIVALEIVILSQERQLSR